MAIDKQLKNKKSGISYNPSACANFSAGIMLAAILPINPDAASVIMI